MSELLGRELLVTVKASTRTDRPALSIPVGCPIEAVLRPVATNKDSLNENDIFLLTAWRNRFVQSFQTEFQADEARTARWLTNLVGCDDTRILFMVDDVNRHTFGYMGLAFIDWQEKRGEADAIVRGGSAAPGAMSRSLRTLLHWACGQLGLCEIGVRVRSDNTALEFYRKFGFQEVKRIPLRKTEDSGMIRWTEDAGLSFTEHNMVHMTLSKAECNVE